MTFMPKFTDEDGDEVYKVTVKGVCPIHGCPMVTYVGVEQCLVEWIIQSVMGQPVKDLAVPDNTGGLVLVHNNTFALPVKKVFQGKREVNEDVLLEKIDKMVATGIKYIFAKENTPPMLRVEYACPDAENEIMLQAYCTVKDLVLWWYWLTMDRIIPD